MSPVTGCAGEVAFDHTGRPTGDPHDWAAQLSLQGARPWRAGLVGRTAVAGGPRGNEAPVAESRARGFGMLLRQLRIQAGLTQEELAEAATLSPRSVSDLERGINATARKETAELLAAALDLAEPARSVFVAAARGRVPAEEVLAI